MKKILSSLIILSFALIMVACGGKKVGTGYGLVHKGYIGEIKVTLKGKNIENVEVEEYFLLDQIGKLAVKEEWKTSDSLENVVVIKKTATDGKVTYSAYAKYILFDTKLYTATNVDNNIQYKNDNKNIVDLVKDEKEAKKYVKALMDNKVFIVDNETATVKSTVLLTDGYTKTSLKKSESGYWPTGGHGKGWKENINKFVEAIIKTGVNATYTLNKDKKWATSDYTSEVTLVDFQDYLAVAKRAFDNAK